jgi:tripartite-type tricarboxylate transporter receptor subunit TctC
MQVLKRTSRRVALATGLAVVLLGLSVAEKAQASDFPNRPIELVVPVVPGGGTDTLARAFASTAQKYFPAQPFVIVNKPGASGAIGFNEVIRAKPDGYKIAMIITELAVLPNLGTVKFAASDLKPIAQLNADPAAITVRADAPWKNMDEFVAAARKPDALLTIGDSGVGSLWHLAAAAFADQADIRVSHVPFMGAAPAVMGLLGGQIDAVAVSPAEVSQQVAAGKLRTLAVMADERAGGIFKNVPTLKEQNVDLSIGAWRGLAAPKDTPQEIVDVLANMAKTVLADAEFQQNMKKIELGLSYLDQSAYTAKIDGQSKYFGQLISKLNISIK